MKQIIFLFHSHIKNKLAFGPSYHHYTSGQELEQILIHSNPFLIVLTLNKLSNSEVHVLVLTTARLE